MRKHVPPRIQQKDGSQEHDEDVSSREGRSRRDFLMSGVAGLAASAIACGTMADGALAAQGAGNSTGPAVPRGRRVLLKGGCVLSLDPHVGDFEDADVLIEGSKIVAIQPNLKVSADVIDASNTIVMPGFVDTHRHMWEGPLRNILPNGLLSDYTRDITGAARAVYRPEDAYIGDLVSALGAINAGVTTVLDWSHIGNSPEHTDAAIQGLRESGSGPCTPVAPGQPDLRTDFRRTSAGCAHDTFRPTTSC